MFEALHIYEVERKGPVQRDPILLAAWRQYSLIDLTHRDLPRHELSGHSER